MKWARSPAGRKALGGPSGHHGIYLVMTISTSSITLKLLILLQPLQLTWFRYTEEALASYLKARDKLTPVTKIMVHCVFALLGKLQTVRCVTYCLRLDPTRAPHRSLLC